MQETPDGLRQTVMHVARGRLEISARYGETSQHGSQFAETESQLGKEPNDDARKGEGAAGYRGLTPGRSGASDGVFRTSREAPERSAGAPGCNLLAV